MLFNPDSSKPAQEVLFSRKNKIQVHPTISLNNVRVERVSYQKHLVILLDEKLNFKQHIDSAISKVNKDISVIKRLRLRRSFIAMPRSNTVSESSCSENTQKAKVWPLFQVLISIQKSEVWQLFQVII